MELADGYLGDVHPDADTAQRDDVQCIVLCAGQHLADCGAPGRWDTFDPPSFLAKMPGDHDEICLTLTELFAWLETRQLLPRATTRDIRRRIAASRPR